MCAYHRTMRSLFPVACHLFTLVLFGCSGGVDESQGEEESAELSAKPRIQILVTVDWEGESLQAQNIQAMHDFRTQMPSVRMVQFLNAAYFTKPGANATDVKAKIREAILPTDERGLHVHGWKRLVEASGVVFRSKPSFWGPQYPLQDDCSFDCGHEIAISGYTEPEMEKIVRFSIDTLYKNGLGRAKSFRRCDHGRRRRSEALPSQDADRGGRRHFGNRHRCGEWRF